MLTRIVFLIASIFVFQPAASASEIFICQLESSHSIKPYDGILSSRKGSVVSEKVEGIGTKFTSTKVLSITGANWTSKTQVNFLIDGISPNKPVSSNGITEYNNNSNFVGFTDFGIGWSFKSYHALNKETKKLVLTTFNIRTSKTVTSFFSCD